MNRSTYVTLVAAAVFSLLLAGNALATEELARTEDLTCTVCHDKPGSKLLTDRGKYYELMRSMDGFAELETSFGQCTFCHRRKPGSKKLTRAGKGFATILGGMEGLIEWVQERHPGWPEESSEPTVGAGGAGQPVDSAPDVGPLQAVPSH